MSFENIAELSGMSKGAICDISNFKSIPSQLSMMKISRAFGLKVQEVFMLDYTKVEL